MNSLRRFVLALLLAMGLVAAPVAAGGIATAAPGPCAAQELALDGVNARAAAHNARWTPTKPQGEAQAYNAEAAEINSEGSFAQSALESCYLLNGINKPIPRTPLGPPNQRPSIQPSKPAPPQPRSVPMPQPGPAPSPSNPTPGYPMPKPISGNPKVVQDTLYDTTIPGARITRFQDGGSTMLNPMIGRAATGQTSYVTNDMTLGGGTRPSPAINPPGWDPSRAWGPGRHSPDALQRLHLQPNVGAGQGFDARNLVTGTKAANDAMTAAEKKVIAAARGGEAVWYNVTPIYGNGFTKPPTYIAVGAVGVRSGVIVPFQLIPNIP